jgi:hypothetical protein
MFKNSRTDLNKTRDILEQKLLNIFHFQKPPPCSNTTIPKTLPFMHRFICGFEEFFVFSCCGVLFSFISYPDSDRPEMKQTFNFGKRGKENLFERDEGCRVAAEPLEVFAFREKRLYGERLVGGSIVVRQHPAVFRPKFRSCVYALLLMDTVKCFG